MKPKKKPSSLSTVVSAFKDHRNYVQSNYRQVWEDSWNVYNGKRVKKSYNGNADLTDPMIYSSVRVAIANIVAGKPKFSFYPTRADQRTDTKILNQLMDFWWDANDMSLIVVPWVKDMLIYGTGVLYTNWDMVRPKATHQPLMDFFVDPMATHPGAQTDARYMGRRFLASKEELMSYEALNPLTGEMEPLYKNLAELGDESSATDLEFDKDIKDMFQGSTVDMADKKQIEVIEYWTKEKVITIGNRRRIIRDETNELGCFPFIVQRNDIDGSLFYGKGEVEINIDQQEYLNDIINQSLDNMTYALNNMWRIDPAFADMADQVESIPGGVYALPDGALTPLDKPAQNFQVYQERNAIKESIREATGIDSVVKGVGQGRGNADVTATEVNQQIQSAQTGFSMKLTMLENEGFKYLSYIWLKMAQRYMTQDSVVRIVGKEGTYFEGIHIDDFMGDYESRVQLDATTKKMQLDDIQRYQAMYTALAQNPLIKQEELVKIVMERVFELDADEVEQLIAPPAPMGDPMMGGAPGAPGAPGASLPNSPAPPMMSPNAAPGFPG